MLILVAMAESKQDLLLAYQSAPPVADLVELRLDRIPESDLEEVFRATGLPRIATCRSRAQGGFFSGSEADRQRILRRSVALGSEYVDLEFQSDDEKMLGDTGSSRPLLSYHHRGGTPLDLEVIYERMAGRAPGAVLKLIPFADACSDNLRVRSLLHQSRRDQRDLIAFCMGDRGKVSRILARAWGSWGVYAPAREEATTAPGQLLLGELADLYREKRLGPATPLTGVLGHPVSGSLSPLLYNRAYENLGIPGCFLPFEAEVVAEFLPLLSELPITGLAITHPHKSSFATHCDELDPVAAEAGAVNTAVRRWNRLVGFNTDVEGSVRPLARVMDLKGAKVGILGAGGAAGAAALGLRKAGSHVTLFSRREEQGASAARRAGCASAGWDKARRFHGDVLINATPVGMAHDSGPSPISWDEARAEVAYDFVYNPPRTRFLQEAAAHGARVLGGAEMFVEQARLQFEILTGSEAPRELWESLLAPYRWESAS